MSKVESDMVVGGGGQTRVEVEGGAVANNARLEVSGVSGMARWVFSVILSFSLPCWDFVLFFLYSLNCELLLQSSIHFRPEVAELVDMVGEGGDSVDKGGVNHAASGKDRR